MKESKILSQGKVLIYPTDTIWGIGCDALNISAIERIKKIKGRDNTKSFILLVRDLEMLSHYVESIPEIALELMQNATSPLTIIYPKAKNLPIEHLSFNQSIGIRIPQNPFLQEIFQEFPYPIVSSSANFSGQPSPKTFQDIDPKLKSMVDFVSNPLNHDKPNSESSQLFLIQENQQVLKLR